jgi:hypothetical protein
MSRAYKTVPARRPSLRGMNEHHHPSDRFHLAQVNIAQLLAPLDDPQLAGFVARLDEINALADGSDGFVWRLQTEAGDATSLRVFDDDRLLVNLSAWRSVEALQQYVYRTVHAELIRQRAAWFERLGRPHYALWWIPAGTLPTVDEAKQRLAHLDAHGPSPQAFQFHKRYTVNDAAMVQAARV